MPNGYINLDGTVALVATDGYPVSLATEGEGLIQFVQNGVIAAEFTSAGNLMFPMASSGISLSITDDITAAGVDITDATALTTAINVVTTTPAATGVILGATDVGVMTLVRNDGANALLVYPENATLIINGASAGVAFTVPVGATATFYKIDALNYIASLVGVPSYGVIQSVSAAVSAAGVDITDATALTALVNNVSTVAAATGVGLPVVAIGQTVTVKNAGANALLVYPSSASDKLNGGSDGAAVSIATAAVGVFIRITATDTMVYEAAAA